MEVVLACGLVPSSRDRYAFPLTGPRHSWSKERIFLDRLKNGVRTMGLAMMAKSARTGQE